MGILEVIWPNPLVQTGCPGPCPHVKYCFCYIQMEFPLKQLVCLVSSGTCALLCRVTSSSLHLPVSYWNTVIRSLPLLGWANHIHQSSNQLGGSLLDSPQFFSVLELKNRMKYSRCALTRAKRNKGSPQAVELPLAHTVQDSPGLVTVRALCSLELAVPQGPP